MQRPDPLITELVVVFLLIALIFLVVLLLPNGR